jgi:hypothetical protein
MSTHFHHSNGNAVPFDPEHPPEEHARERRERQRNYPPLLKYINKTCDAVASLDKQERVRIREAQVKAVAFYDGRQDGEVRDGIWQDNEYINGEIRPEDNQYKIQIDKLNMEMCRAPFEFDVEAVDPSDSDAEEAAKFFKHRLDINRERTETEPFRQQENLSLLTKSVTFRHVFFDPNEPGDAPERMPKLLPKGGQSMRVTVCRTCGLPQGVGGRNEQLDTPDVVEKAEVRAPCEVCGDSAVKELSVQTSGGMDISYEEVPGGRVVTVRPDAIAVQLDMQARDIKSSRFLRWVLTLRRCEWEAMFPGKRIPKARERKSEEGRWAEDLQGRASNDTWGSLEYDSPGEHDITGGEQFEKIEGELVWLDRVVYADYVNPKLERTPSGEIPEGWVPAEEYPDGCCVARIGTTVLDLYPSNKNECWTMCVYGLREHALHGAGTFSMLGPCNTINDLNAYIQANNYYNAAPREFIKSGALAGNQLPSIGTVGVVTTQFDENQRIVGNAYDKAPATSLAPDVYAFREGQRGSLQEHAGTSSLSMQGAADMKQLGTATGVEAARDQAVGRMIPNLKLQQGMVVEWMYQVGQLERANCSPEMFLRGAGKGSEKGEVNYTERGVRAFFERDPRKDFRIKPVEGSWVPTTPAQSKANATEFGVLASQIQNPEVLALLAPKYGVEYTVNEWGATERAASLRLREWARIASVIEQGGYPATPEMAEVVLQQAPAWAQINPAMDNHPAYMNYLTDWWTSDEGTGASPLLRMVVEKAHLIHGAGGVVQEQLKGVASMAAQAPQMAAQEEQQAAQTEEQAQMKAAELGMQAEEKEAEREHQLTLAVAKQGEK